MLFIKLVLAETRSIYLDETNLPKK
uniref:Uncharacterized protein n=1 Tax=Rhizophora mucronata TaxID=61149 RepID=A0A2P2PHQ1_RHIMU